MPEREGVMSEEEYLALTMPQRATAHIRGLMEQSPAIARQYDKSAAAEYAVAVATGQAQLAPYVDSLGEDEYEKRAVKGVIDKYANVRFIKVSYRCAAHCQFCTRTRQIGSDEGDLTEQDIDNIVNYARDNPKPDVLLSGGDPFFTSRTTNELLQKLSQLDSIKSFRIGTRIHHHAPSVLKSRPGLELLGTIAEIAEDRTFTILLNAQHPDELKSPETLEAIKTLSLIPGVSLRAQTVFLKGVNDSYESMYDLFLLLYGLKVYPYIAYHCDRNRGIEEFVCNIADEREIMTRLKSNLPGLAVPIHVVDVPGKGKIPVPLLYWDDTDMSHVRDYDGNEINLSSE